MFDYNPTQLGAAALLWTAWALTCRGLVAALVAALAACLTKENTCLYVAVVAAVLALRVARRRNAIAVAALALALFALEMTVLFPRFREGGFRHWEYEDLGETPGESAAAALARPDRPAALLVNHPKKRRALLLPLTTTGYIGLADPLSVVLQLPNWAERLLSTHGTRWWGYHYGVPAAATACIGLMLGWRRLRAAGRDGRFLPRYVIGCALVCGLLPPYRTRGRQHAQRPLLPPPVVRRRAGGRGDTAPCRRVHRARTRSSRSPRRTRCCRPWPDGRRSTCWTAPWRRTWWRCR